MGCDRRYKVTETDFMTSLRRQYCAIHAHLIALFALGLSACGDASAPAPQICDASADIQATEQPVIYGEATWVGPEAAADLLSASKATAIAAEVAILRIGNQTGADGASLTESSLLCDGEPLSDEVALAGCSGVLIAPDLMVTAKHCTEAVPCKEMVVTTDFDTVLHPGDNWAFDGRRCVRVLAADHALDTAIVELAPTSDKAIPVAALRLEPITNTTPVILISHPLGTSTKVDLDADARPSARGPGHMWFRGDAFKGSSGAGVVDANGRLVGIVTAGLSDFNYDREAGCMRLVRFDSEGFERLASITSVLRDACEILPEHSLCNEIFNTPAAKPDQPEPEQFEPVQPEPEQSAPDQSEQIGCR